MLNSVWFALLITLLLALIWLRFIDFLAHKGFINGPLSRKIIHIGTGPIFVLCWLLFPETPSARYLAALIPLGITIQFFLVGAGIIKDQAAVDAMSRHGERREILRGPLFYGIVFVILTLIYWRDSLTGIIALMLLCGGDGLADVVGKRFGSIRLPWSKNKSLQGSFAMFAGGWLLSVGVLVIYISQGYFSTDMLAILPSITLISAVGMIVESIPFNDIDNVTVPLVAVMLSHIMFP